MPALCYFVAIENAKIALWTATFHYDDYQERFEISFSAIYHIFFSFFLSYL